MVVCQWLQTGGHSLWPLLLSTASPLICKFSLVEGSRCTWCSPLTCHISWRDSERSPCWGFWPWRALYRSGWDYRASRMDRYLHCSSVAVLQHKEKSISTERGSVLMLWHSLSQGNIWDTRLQRHKTTPATKEKVWQNWNILDKNSAFLTILWR